jgi:serine/threonine protein kinase
MSETQTLPQPAEFPKLQIIPEAAGDLAAMETIVEKKVLGFHALDGSRMVLKRYDVQLDTNSIPQIEGLEYIDDNGVLWVQFDPQGDVDEWINRAATHESENNGGMLRFFRETLSQMRMSQLYPQNVLGIQGIALVPEQMNGKTVYDIRIVMERVEDLPDIEYFETEEDTNRAIILDRVVFLRKIAQVLDDAHKLGIVHRDVKPGNILFKEGEPLLADFGIALIKGHTEGDSIGTAKYLSPEQMMDSSKAVGASDQLAMGIMILEEIVKDSNLKVMMNRFKNIDVEAGSAIYEISVARNVAANEGENTFDFRKVVEILSEIVGSDCAVSAAKVFVKLGEFYPDGRYGSVTEMVDALIIAFGGQITEESST